MTKMSGLEREITPQGTGFAMALELKKGWEIDF